jgi:superfamily II DNA/RNA helicase
MCTLPAQGFTLKRVQHLVLDEADRLLNMDFEEEINQILKVLSTRQSNHPSRVWDPSSHDTTGRLSRQF